MWLINFIPGWVFHLVALIGILLVLASVVLDYIPFISRFKSPVLIIGFVISAAGLFFEGVLYSSYSWNEKVAELEKKVALSEVESAKQNTKIITKYITSVQEVKDKTNDNIEYIEKYVTVYDDKCDVPNSAIVLHNSASQNQVPPGPGGAYEGTSDVKISEFTTTVVENYGTYYQLSEQLKAWQDWYKTQKDIFEKAFN